MERQALLIVTIRFFLLCALFGEHQMEAAVFTVDSSQSQLSLSGQIGGYTLTSQATGSLTTSYKGSINVEVAGSAIRFTGSSTIPAITNGIWRPALGGNLGVAPADYGAQASIPFSGTGYGAGRNIVLDITSSPLALTGTNYDSSKLTISMPTNSGAVFDYMAGTQKGSAPLYGSSTNAVATGSFISTNGDLVKLVVQINMTIAGTNGTVLNFTGKLTATNSLSASLPPVITSLLVTNHNFVLTVSNATAQSKLLSSTNLASWTPAAATSNVNGALIIYTTPMTGSHTFYRVQK